MEDNARKFIVEKINSDFLKENSSVSFILVVDWLVTDENSEKKLAYKKFDNGDIQILLISKVTKDGSRVTDKKKISEAEYKELLGSSILHLEKNRHEFNYVQNGTTYSMKYDEFKNGGLCILEADASNEDERAKFDPDSFIYKLSEVTGDMRYYGYRIANEVN